MKNTLIIILSLILLNSCSNILDTKVYGYLEENEVYEDISSFEVMLNACYAKLKSESFLGGSLSIALPDIMSDNTVYSSENNGNLISFHNWKFDSSTPEIEQIWLAAYSTIRSANQVINNIDVIRNDKNTLKVNSILAQAYTMRALCHFHLYKWFSDSQTNNSIVYVLDNKQFDSKPVNNTKQEILNYCISDLDAAEKLQIIARENFYLSPSCVHFLKMQIALDIKNYPEVIKQADLVLAINNKISTPEEFASMWKTDNSPEVIFRIRFTTADKPKNAWLLYDTRNKRSTWLADESLMQLYEPTDIRLKAYFVENKDKTYSIIKYLGRDNEDMPNGNDVKLMRTSEVYLSKAEAMININADKTEALSLINKIRVNRNLKPVADSKNIIKNLRDERRREFAFEGMRFYDLRRWDMNVKRESKSTTQQLISMDIHWSFPIPLGEINANENIKQNTDY